jgi:hypothetical protein
MTFEIMNLNVRFVVRMCLTVLKTNCIGKYSDLIVVKYLGQKATTTGER